MSDPRAPSPEEMHEMRERLLGEIRGAMLDCKERARRGIRKAKASPEGRSVIAAVRLARTPDRSEKDVYEFLIVLAGEARRKTRERDEE